MKTEPPFLTLARKPDLDQETAFTICRMIDSVGWDLVDDWDWDWLKGEPENYRSLIKHPILEGCWKSLFEKDWFSQQTTNDVDKKISTIAPLEGLTKLRTLILQNNLIRDLQPLETMVKLTYLSCYSNRVSDLTPLANLKELEKLNLANNPVTSFKVLEDLPNLRELRISTEQFPKFVQCKRLPKLRSLDISGEDAPIDNLASLPEMPELKVLEVRRLQDLRGVERFTNLENLSLWYGDFSDLEPLKGLKSLTHLEVVTSKAITAEALGGLYQLRKIYLSSPKVEDKDALDRLPALRAMNIKDSSDDSEEPNEVKTEISSWDADFKADTQTVQPSLELQVVDQETFDHYDSKAAYGIHPGESDKKMLGSEHNWLVEQLREALSGKFEDDVDFHLPYTSGGRTERLVLYSLAAYESFRDIATAVQQILCSTKNDWIIWCQALPSEGPDVEDIPENVEDFIVWIYPNKIMTTEEHAETVRNLVDWKN